MRPGSITTGMSHNSNIKRIIELSGMPGTGKTTLARALVKALPAGTRVGHREPFAAPMQRPAYFGLMLRHPWCWWTLYRHLRGILSGRMARRRLRMYIKHLWRRRQQIHLARFDLIIEDEAFATYLARDLDRCPAMAEWVRANIALFYPRHVRGTAADYLLVVLSCDEATRRERLHQRRLRKGPEYAAAEHARDGYHESRASVVPVMTALLRDEGLVRTAETPDAHAALRCDPMAAYPHRSGHDVPDDRA